MQVRDKMEGKGSRESVQSKQSQDSGMPKKSSLSTSSMGGGDGGEAKTRERTLPAEAVKKPSTKAERRVMQVEIYRALCRIINDNNNKSTN